MISSSEKECPNCGFGKATGWTELDRDQKLLVEKLPGSAEFLPEERKKHRFCTRCWFEVAVEEEGPNIADSRVRRSTRPICQ
jgi:ribosomal protein L37E